MAARLGSVVVGTESSFASVETSWSFPSSSTLEVFIHKSFFAVNASHDFNRNGMRELPSI